MTTPTTFWRLAGVSYVQVGSLFCCHSLSIIFFSYLDGRWFICTRFCSGSGGGGGGIFLGKKKADNWPTYVHSVLEETFNEKNVVEESLW